jgi:hypothetical protein
LESRVTNLETDKSNDDAQYVNASGDIITGSLTAVNAQFAVNGASGGFAMADRTVPLEYGILYQQGGVVRLFESGVGDILMLHRSGTYHLVWDGTAHRQLWHSGNFDPATISVSFATLQSSLNNEASTRATADTALQTNIDNEAAARIAGDNTLTTNLAAEATTRATTDTALSGRIAALEGRPAITSIGSGLNLSAGVLTATASGGTTYTFTRETV